MLKFIIVLLFFIPNICMAEYCEYKKLPYLKKFLEINEYIHLFDRGISYCIEPKLFEESFFIMLILNIVQIYLHMINQ